MLETPFATTKTAQGIRRRSPYLGPDSQTLDPKTDVVFKLLFAAERNRHLLIKLLSAVLKPACPIAEVRVLNPELEPSEYGDKRAVLDILAAFEDGSQVDIEMQALPHEAIEERLVFYWAKTYSSQLGAGDPHTQLEPVIGIYFLAFMRLPSSRAHSTFHINEDQEGFPLTDALELHFLELPKYATLEESDRLPERVDGDQADELVYWCKFLAAETEAEQEALAMANPDISEAKTRLDELSGDPKARKLAEDRVLWEWAYHQDIDGAERRGREEGLRNGREEGLRDGRKEGRDEGLRDGRKEGRDEGLRDGRKEGLRDAVRTACELVGIELTDDRNAKLESSSLEELESLLTALKRNREWPQ